MRSYIQFTFAAGKEARLLLPPGNAAASNKLKFKAGNKGQWEDVKVESVNVGEDEAKHCVGLILDAKHGQDDGEWNLQVERA